MPASDLDNLLYWSDADDLDKRDRTRAGPSDEHLVIMWSIYSPLLFFFSFVVVIVSLAIVTNPKVRRNPFNKYILFLSIPDFVYTFLCAITCLVSAVNNGYTSWGMCQFQVFYLTFGNSANAWLNGLMAWEVYKLLRSSHIRRRYFPPTDKQVYISSLACYGIAIVAASLPLLGSVVEWLAPAGIQAGFLCLSAEQNLTQALVWWFVNAPITFAVPYTYAAWVFYDVVFRSKLLPPKGKRRELTVYFFRIGAVFLFLWTPTIAALTFFKGMLPPWWTWGFGLFSHTQGFVSALMTMGKQDVRDAVRDFVFGCFRCASTGDVDKGKEPSPSKFETMNSTCVEGADSLQDEQGGAANQATVDDLGLPIQGSNFLFLDEASSRNFVSEGRNDDEEQVSSGFDKWTENPREALSSDV
eukprot:Nitzschia sp. Nitz4//scaffold160_size51814//1061//2385//NITZ4_006907-RA/size51814-processed-gene-0.48-mRNA-1//1//CDS//3329537836//1416//frame0